MWRHQGRWPGHHRVCMLFTDAGTQEAVVQVRGVETGFWEFGPEVLGDPRGDAERAAGCAAERSGLERQRSHEHPGGKSGVCGGAHLEARCEGGSMQVGTGGEGGGAEKELAEETRSPSQQLSPDGRQQG